MSQEKESLNSEWGKIVENAFSKVRLSDIIVRTDIDELIATGTTIPKEKLLVLIEKLALSAKEIEGVIQGGTTNWDIRRQIDRGVIDFISAEGSRAIVKLVESIALKAGYAGELHSNTLQPQKGLVVSMQYNDLNPGQSPQIVLYKPLSNTEIAGNQSSEIWQVAVRRSFEQSGVGPMGLSYIRTEEGSE